MSDNRALGALGEQAACVFLTRHGYTILDRNVRICRAELDIIARIDETIVFCEVKTRSGDRFGTPGEAVTARKREHIFRASVLYLERHREFSDCSMRFDVIEVIHVKDHCSVRHIPNAFDAQNSSYFF